MTVESNVIRVKREHANLLLKHNIKVQREGDPEYVYITLNDSLTKLIKEEFEEANLPITVEKTILHTTKDQTKHNKPVLRDRDDDNEEIQKVLSMVLKNCPNQLDKN